MILPTARVSAGSLDRIHRGILLARRRTYLSRNTNFRPSTRNAASAWQVSGGGGSQPRWRRDSREIYYVNPAGDMTAVTVNAASTFDIGARTPLFRTRVGAMLAPFRINYDVAPDGQRFLINSPLPDPDPTRVTLVLNWESELGGRARTGR